MHRLSSVAWCHDHQSVTSNPCWLSYFCTGILVQDGSVSVFLRGKQTRWKVWFHPSAQQQHNVIAIFWGAPGTLLLIVHIKSLPACKQVYQVKNLRQSHTVNCDKKSRDTSWTELDCSHWCILRTGDQTFNMVTEFPSGLLKYWSQKKKKCRYSHR